MVFVEHVIYMIIQGQKRVKFKEFNTLLYTFLPPGIFIKTKLINNDKIIDLDS